MADLRHKAEREAATAERARRVHLRETGYTVFPFDFAPKFTRRDLTLGDAVRELKRLTGYKVGFWRCPVRGMAVEFREPPRTTYAWDKGDISRLLCFSIQEDERAAKMELVEHVVLAGLGLFRGLPNKVFDEQVAIIRSLLTAPPSVDREEWLGLKAKLHARIEPLLHTHQADLRANLIGYS